MITSPIAKPPPTIDPALMIIFLYPVVTKTCASAISLCSLSLKSGSVSVLPPTESTYAFVAASEALVGVAKLVIVLFAAFKSSVIGTAPLGASTPGPNLLATGAPVTS